MRYLKAALVWITVAPLAALLASGLLLALAIAGAALIWVLGAV